MSKKKQQTLDAKILVRCTAAELKRFKQMAGKREFSKWVRAVLVYAVDNNLGALKEKEPVITKKLLSRLNPRSADVVEKRMKGKTLKQVADEIGVSGERVRQIQSEAIKKIKSLSKKGSK